MLKPWHKIWLSGVEFKLEGIKSGRGGEGFGWSRAFSYFSYLSSMIQQNQVKSVKIDIFKDEN